MVYLKHLLALSSLLSLGRSQWSPNVPVETRSLDEIYEAAKKESGTLIVSSGGDAGNQNDAIIQAFQKRFPDIQLNWTVDLSKYHTARIDRGFYADNQTTDVVILQTLHDFPRWKEQNRLLYYKPSVWNDIYASERDPDGAYLPIAEYSFGDIAWDTAKMNESAIPDDYASFTHPKWRGRLVLTYPNDDDAVLYLFSKIISRYGFEWLYALQANDVQWVRGSYTPAAVIEAAHNSTRNPRSVTFTTGDAFGGWWGSKTPSKDESMSWSQTGAIFADTKMPETSKLLLSFLVSDEWQKPQADSGSFVPRVSLDQGKLYEQKNSEVGGFRVWMNQRNLVDWWKSQLETTLGTPQGPSPLDLYPRV
ncbi:hypothetical protein ETB97_000868 [Aspergillus alliaceus]|uniref:ABC-type Fe3+ transport system n=1 Tax=Petromyces alliaceus TaxID=209559 RepID=A0A5N7CHP8_PETAA|nr:uncharacterized protein BDW43DRAFT_279496 [Aspergillus alliaceus]KAB8232482.1 hypothetical protein BDW43DRAFT_279496 [Aspergillus alliaceus]KAE8393417.1 hypothetical protein BDV23DRAFT_149628 [Aspergillus alliaceus]KAF5860958.1 hypothetical protein ETB97_000868 [Aspergillus burnettii]